MHVASATPAEVRKSLVDRGLTPAAVSAIRATAFLVDHNSKKHIPDGVLFSYRPLAAEEIALTEDQTTQILTLLADRLTYVPDLIKACAPSYELGITFASTEGYTEILFCLGCDKLLLATNDGRRRVIADIDRGHNELLRIFRGLYPQNVALQRIQPSNPEKQFSAKIAIEWAEICIPDDPLLKRIRAMKPEEQTDELVEELATKATAAMRGTNKKPSKRKSK